MQLDFYPPKFLLSHQGYIDPEDIICWKAVSPSILHAYPTQLPLHNQPSMAHAKMNRWIPDLRFCPVHLQPYNHPMASCVWHREYDTIWGWKKRLILLYLCSLCGTEKQLVKHLFLWASLFQNLLQMTLMGSPCLHCHTIHIHSRLGSKYSIEYIFIHTLTTKYLNNWIDSRHNTWAYFHARYKSLGICSGPKIWSVLVNWSLWST